MEDDAYRDKLIDAAAAAYARGVIEQPDFENLVIRINAAADSAGLLALAGNLPAVFGTPAAPALQAAGLVWEEIRLNMGNDKRTGDWVRADGYRLKGRMSNFELDLRDYDGATGFRLALEVELDMSNLRLTVPEGWTVDCRIDENSASNIKHKGQGSAWGDNLVRITGRLRMSNIKVKYT